MSGSQLLKNLEGMKTPKYFNGLSEMESKFLFFLKGMKEKAQLILPFTDQPSPLRLKNSRQQTGRKCQGDGVMRDSAWKREMGKTSF